MHFTVVNDSGNGICSNEKMQVKVGNVRLIFFCSLFRETYIFDGLPKLRSVLDDLIIFCDILPSNTRHLTFRTIKQKSTIDINPYVSLPVSRHRALRCLSRNEIQTNARELRNSDTKTTYASLVMKFTRQ